MARILLIARESFLYQSTNPLDLAEALAVDGHEVFVAAPFVPSARVAHGSRGFTIDTIAPLGRGGNPTLWWRALEIARLRRPTVVIGVNPVGFLAADFAKGCGYARRVVYYDLEASVVADHRWSLSTRWVASRAPFADLVISTSPERAADTQASLGLPTTPFAVANAALRSFGPEASTLREQVRAAGCTAKELIIYVGALSTVVRLTEAARASRLWQRDAALVIIGFGGSPEELRSLHEAVRDSGGRTVLLPPFSAGRDTVISLAAGADAGLVLYDHRTFPSRNVMLATPNKLFDYLAAGLPAIGSDTPALMSFIEGQGMGACANPRDPAAIATAVDRVLSDRARLAARARELFAMRYNYTTQSAAARERLGELARNP